ncbi:Rpn family recombination-promoting nuclease/putative transposase [Anaerolineales bacterium HSG25]|nr:Rpn family recombination-promoting nuclease/putative transposase [Anaerolineales bacterium HSG25]
MIEKLTNPHDKYFRDMFSRQEVALDFVQNYLPADVVSHLDLSRLEISKDSFVDPDLKEHFSDMLYQVGLQDKQTAYVYLLFDHKSYVDSLVAFQLLKYATKIWDMQLKQRRVDERQKGERIRLAPIFPLVVYHGERKWTASRQFIDLFDAPDELKPYIPNFEYWLCDLTQYSDGQIIGQALLQICLRLLKYSRAEDILARLPEIFRLFEEIISKQTALEVLYSALRYLSNSSENLTKEQLTQVVETVFEEGGDTMATIAQQLRMEGRVEGRVEGVAAERVKTQKAEQRARQNEQRARQNEQRARQNEQRARQNEQRAKHAFLNSIRQTLVIRFDTALDRYDKRLKKLELPSLEQLSDLVFEVPTLAEFEASLTKLEKPPETDAPPPDQAQTESET